MYMSCRVMQCSRVTNTKPVRLYPILPLFKTNTEIVIPYTKVFLTESPKPEHIFLQAEVTELRPNNVTLSRSFPELGIPTTTLAFDYAIYALGSHLPPPLDLWGPPTGKTQYRGQKSEGCQWFKEKQQMIKDAPTVLVVGGGALGIRMFDFSPDIYRRILTFFLEFATDIKSVYPEKSVTLLHSRQRLLPRFDEKMHDESKFDLPPNIPPY